MATWRPAAGKPKETTASERAAPLPVTATAGAGAALLGVLARPPCCRSCCCSRCRLLTAHLVAGRPGSAGWVGAGRAAAASACGLGCSRAAETARAGAWRVLLLLGCVEAGLGLRPGSAGHGRRLLAF